MRVTEEFALLLIDDEKGAMRPIPGNALKWAVAGATLIDLELAARIDSDLESIELLDSNPLGDNLLDPVLREIIEDCDNRDIGYWVEKIGLRADDILETAISNLVRYKILENPSDTGFLSLARGVKRSKRYMTADLSKRELIDLRIQRVLFDGDVPDPADIPIICLADACNLFSTLLLADELASVRERLDTISRLSLIGQVVSRHIERDTSAIKSGVRAATAPLARGWPVVGNLFQVKGNLGGFLANTYNELGPVFRTRLVGKKSERIILAGREANLFLSGMGQHFVKPVEVWGDVIKEFGGDRLLVSMDGPDHVSMRRRLQPQYSARCAASKIQQTVDVIQEEASSWPTQKPISGTYAVKRLLTAQLMLLATGKPHWDYIDDMIYVAAIVVEAHLFQVGKFRLKGKRFRESRRRLDEFYETIMSDHRLRLRNSEYNVINTIMEIHESDRAFLPEIDFKMNAILPLLVGIDTAGGVLSFMLYHILSDPGLREHVQEQVDQLFPKEGVPSAQTVRSMDVLARVMMETMRIHPPASVLPRRAATSFDFGGYRINAGEKVMFATAATHFLNEYFPDPERFDIERFAPERGEHKLKGIYVPFGIGRHGCLGSSLANLQIVLTVATLLRYYDLVLSPPDYQLRSTIFPLLSPDKRFRFKVTGRHY